MDLNQFLNDKSLRDDEVFEALVDSGVPRSILLEAETNAKAEYKRVCKYIHDLVETRKPVKGFEAAMFVTGMLDKLREMEGISAILFMVLARDLAEKEVKPQHKI